jgi:hypothetical protein
MSSSNSKKLDLLNSRLVLVNPNRVYDSLEGVPVRQQKPPPILSRISFTSTTPKIQEPIKSCAPQIWDSSKIDRYGNIVDLTSQLSRLKSEPSTNVLGAEIKTILDVPLDPKDPNNYWPTLDRIKDHEHEFDVDSVKSRIESKKLPGASWSDVERMPESRSHYTGHDFYDTEAFERSKYGGKHKIELKFNDIPSGRGMEKPVTPPIKERLRIKRMQAAQEQLQKSRSKSPKYGHSLHSDPAVQDYRAKSVPAIRFSQCSRWGRNEEESYIKTSGMRLGNDWHHIFDTKIPFTFNSQSYTTEKTVAPEYSDVDVSKYYDIANTVENSPVRYSAAFISKAKVGMEIPVPTSGENGGPGSFPGAFESSVKLKNLKIMTRPRNFPVKQALPDVNAPVKQFSETHSRGPFFEMSGAVSKNPYMADKVKSCVSKIYPKLGSQLFPEPTKIVLDPKFMMVKPPKRK